MRRPLRSVTPRHAPSVGPRPGVARTRHEVSVAPPYRLDLTVSVLRRSSANLVDVLAPDGAYVRVIGDGRAPVFVRVSQTGPETLVAALGPPLEWEGVRVFAFPTAESVLRADDRDLRAAGLSAAKLATLRRVGEALASGTLTEAMLDERTSPEAAALLSSIKGIGPRTAANVLLRGLGRLDVFPANDSSVARNLASP